MQPAEILWLIMWVLAGFFITLGCITNNPKMRVNSLFYIENRWGQFTIGIILLVFVIMRVVNWMTSENPTVYWNSL